MLAGDNAFFCDCPEYCKQTAAKPSQLAANTNNPSTNPTFRGLNGMIGQGIRHLFLVCTLKATPVNVSAYLPTINPHTHSHPCILPSDYHRKTSMQRSNQENRSLRSRLLSVIPKFRSSSPQPPQRGADGASTPVPVPQMDDESSTQAPSLIDNAYTAIVEVPATTVDPTMGSVVYEGLKTVLQGLYDCSDMFLPLKAAAGSLLTIFKIVDVRGFEIWFMNC